MEEPEDPARHRERHRMLHDYLDELVADYLHHHPERGLNNSTLMELLLWSTDQAEQPWPTESGGRVRGQAS